MTDYFALLGAARRPWLEPEQLKEQYFNMNRAEEPSAELNEAFRVLCDPKLRLQHLLKLEGIELPAGRPVPAKVAELFWQAGAVLRETEAWLRQNSEATGNLARAMLHPTRAQLEEKLGKLDDALHAVYESEMAALRRLDAGWRAEPNELAELIELADSISYLTPLLERTKEGRFRLSAA
ncbi:MAG: hypothetical protein H0X40_18570 [Chthoniobacterales bacterium]|nr:hypothetical protein [Chthoniobacterales bacterium]